MIVTLIDGTRVESSELTLNQSTYHVFWGTVDITANMRQNDKVLVFPNFSRATDNNRASDESPYHPPTVVGSTSTAAIFWNQIIHEPLKAPFEAASAGLKQVWATPFGKLVLIGGGIALALYTVNTLAKLKTLPAP